MPPLILVAAGLALLVVGGELLVRGAVGGARALGVSPLVIGIVVVGFGTSAPELVTSLVAAYEDAPGLVIGNVIGSNIANILLILGLAALIAPIPAGPRPFRRDLPALAAATILFAALLSVGHVGRLAAAALLLAFAAYLVVVYRSEHHDSQPDAAPLPGPAPKPAWALAQTVAGMAGTIAGAWLLVEGATDVARAWGVSETVIGLTIVAVGTSLPELVACAAASWRGQPGIALGNVIGSNIFNALGVFGLTALARPVPVPADALGADIWILIAATAFLLLFLRSNYRLGRLEGATLLAGYAAYLAFQAIPSQ